MSGEHDIDRVNPESNPYTESSNDMDSTNMFYSVKNIEVLKRRIDDINNGLNVHEHELIEADD
jgi:hypothetical protein